jgi:hypothetical protein
MFVLYCFSFIQYLALSFHPHTVIQAYQICQCLVKHFAIKLARGTLLLSGCKCQLMFCLRHMPINYIIETIFPNMVHRET